MDMDMDTTSSVLYSILALLLLYLIIKYRTASLWSDSEHHRHGLNLPPGPWKLPVIGSLHHLIGAAAHPHRALRELSSRHGPLMFLKFGEVPAVVVSSREAAREVMKTHDAILCSRPQTSTVKIINKRGADIVVAPYGDHWRQLRKICMVELLCAKRVQSFRAIREEESMRLIHAVVSNSSSSSASASASASAVNLTELVALYANDVAVRCIMGDRLRNRDAFLRQVTRAIAVGGTFRLADLFPSSKLACALSHMFRKAEVFLDGIYEMMDDVIGEHLERRSITMTSTQAEEAAAHQEDLMSILLRIQKQEDDLEHPISMGTVKAVLFDLLTGGTESVTALLQWALAELLRNPDAMHRAQSEVSAAFMGQMKVTEDGLNNLCYLQWVMKETLRLHPPGPILIPRESLEACHIMGYHVPKGTLVIVNAWAISRDPEYWDEPEVFKPERFETDKRDFKGHDFEFTPFGAGRRICPGISFSITTAQLALANILFHFDWKLPEGMLASEIDMEETMGITAKKKTDLWLEPIVRAPLV